MFFFFFQAEDGIRDWSVTGVQTCALPISVIAENRALAQRLQINGTPSFVLQDQMLRGYVPLAQMMTLVDEKRTAN